MSFHGKAQQCYAPVETPVVKINHNPSKFHKNPHHNNSINSNKNFSDNSQIEHENDFKLSQQLSVKSHHPTKKQQIKHEKPKTTQKPAIQMPDPNFLITMKLIDPNFDLGEFMKNLTGPTLKEAENKDFVESLEGINPNAKFGIRAIFNDQNNVLKGIERELKIIRDDKEKDDKAQVLEKIRAIEKDLSRKEKDKKFDRFKDDLFSVS
jgi:hypothetical protein